MNTTVKKKGIIRTEVLLPLLIVTVLFTFYFKYFFDSHLRSGLEFVATRIHGAEVNVSSLKTNFFAPSLFIYGIQITDKKEPVKNILEIGQIRLKLLWDALLRGKFVIPEASILQIKTDSKRNRPGRILPPNKRKSKNPLTRATEKTLDQLKQKNRSNLLSDILSLAKGTNYKDQLKKLENDFEAQKKIKILGESLKDKEKEWKKHIERLPNESQIKQLTKKMESIKMDLSNPESIKNSLGKVDSLYKELKTKYKTIENIKETFKTDIKKYRDQYQELEKIIQQDVDKALKKLNIPSLDLKEINKMLLGNLVASQLKILMKYKDSARKYMPNKTPKNQELTPAQRAEGVNYRFPKNKSYPRFWLKKAQVSSQFKNGETGYVTGILKNLTNNPKLLGFPTILDLKGDFPKNEIIGASIHLNVDHTTSVEKESGSLFVKSFPLKKNLLLQSRDMVLGYEKAIGQSEIDFELKNQELSFQSKNFFKNVNYSVKARNKNLKRIMDEILKKLNTLDFSINVKGSWDHFSLGINSDLAYKLMNAITSQISTEVANIRKNAEKQIKDLINKNKNELKKQINQIERQWMFSFKKSEKSVQSMETQVQKKKEEILKKETKKIEEKGKKEIKKLLEKIKF